MDGKFPLNKTERKKTLSYVFYPFIPQFTVCKRFNNTYMCAWLCGLPGDIEEWKTNAVFDEDGEIVHVQHRLAGKGEQEKGAER